MGRPPHIKEPPLTDPLSLCTHTMQRSSNGKPRNTDPHDQSMNPRKSPYDVLMKLLLISDSGVGKSSVLLRYCDDVFETSFLSTIGIDFKIRTIELDDKKVKLQIWDTAGQERFRTITQAYYRGAMGIILVYDVTDDQSFNRIRTWMRNVEQHANENVVKILLGNKCDMGRKRMVTWQQGADLAMEYGIEFFETSAKANVNVEEAFTAITRSVPNRMEPQLPVPRPVHARLEDEEETTPKRTCWGWLRAG